MATRTAMHRAGAVVLGQLLSSSEAAPQQAPCRLWPFGPLSRYPAEATGHRRGRSPLPTSLRSLPPLSSRTEPARPRVGRRGDRLLAWSTPDDGDGGE
jgi:hypothetical protein